MPSKKQKTNVHIDMDLVDYIDRLANDWRMTSRSAVITRILADHSEKYINNKKISVEELEDFCRNGLEFKELIRLTGFIWSLISEKLGNNSDDKFQQIFEKVTKSECTEAEIIQFCAENGIKQELQEELRKILEIKNKNANNKLKNGSN